MENLNIPQIKKKFSFLFSANLFFFLISIKRKFFDLCKNISKLVKKKLLREKCEIDVIFQNRWKINGKSEFSRDFSIKIFCF
jgi:hypothetical protein